MQTRGNLQARTNLVECHVRPNAISGSEQHEVLVVGLGAPLVVESRLPELRLAPQIVHAENDRADANHRYERGRVLSGS